MPKWVDFLQQNPSNSCITCSEGLLPPLMREGNQDTILSSSRSSVASAPATSPGLARICFARVNMSCAEGMSWLGSLRPPY